LSEHTKHSFKLIFQLHVYNYKTALCMICLNKPDANQVWNWRE